MRLALRSGAGKLTHEPNDFVALLVALLAFVTSREVAILIGPYAAIVVSASAGAALSLSGNARAMKLMEAAWYVTIRILAAVVLTVALAELLQSVAPWAKPRYTLIPLAFGFGWIRDYNAIREWIGRTIIRRAPKWFPNGRK